MNADAEAVGIELLHCTAQGTNIRCIVIQKYHINIKFRPEKLKYRQLARLQGNEVVPLETDA